MRCQNALFILVSYNLPNRHTKILRSMWETGTYACAETSEPNFMKQTAFYLGNFQVRKEC